MAAPALVTGPGMTPGGIFHDPVMQPRSNPAMPRKDSAMVLRATPKAHRELHPGLQTLTLRQRSVLLLAERRSGADRLARLFNGMGAEIVGDLLARGYLAAEADDPATAVESPWKRDITGIEPNHEDL